MSQTECSRGDETHLVSAKKCGCQVALLRAHLLQLNAVG